MASLQKTVRKVICDVDSDRFNLDQHKDSLSYGDLVWVTETKLLYAIINPANLALTSGYALLAAG